MFCTLFVQHCAVGSENRLISMLRLHSAVAAKH